ncbi:MAG: sigma-70 family RNA polymerase sigma factor [Deltaproteobacteria bacterium]|nr:sigma-70 family RNA polymerase sigma factor [Deltaproteobacteria bacterium]
MDERSATRRLVRAALEGDRGATRELVARLRPAIQAELAHLLVQYKPGRGRSARQELADLVQDVFVALWAHEGKLLQRWEPERGRALESYVRLVARSRALDILRSRKRMPWQEEPTEAPAIEAAAEPEHATQARQVNARQALRVLQTRMREQLGARDWQLFTALYTEDLSVQQVSEEVGMTPAAVYQWRSRFVRKVLPRLADGLERGRAP